MKFNTENISAPKHSDFDDVSWGDGRSIGRHDRGWGALPAWIEPTHQTRACFFCVHAQNPADPLRARCAAPAVVHARPAIPLSEARASHDVTACGPEARHFKHVNPRGRE